MAIPEGFSVVNDTASPSIPEGFSVIPEGFSAYKEEEDTPILGAAENALSMVTGSVAMPLAGLAGLATLNPDNVGKVNEALTYQPRSKTGKKYQEAIGKGYEDYLRQPLIKAMTPIQMGENEGELVGTIGADALLNLLPLGAAGKAGSSVAKGMARRAAEKAPSPRLSKLDEIAQRKVVEAEEAAKPTVYVDKQKNATEGLPTRIEESPEMVEFARQAALKKEAEAKGTVYVDKEGVASKDLGTQIKEDPAVIDAARDAQQQALELRARETGKGTGETPDMFDRPPEQLPLANVPFRAKQGQRGAINLSDIKASEDFVKKGFASLRDHLESFKGTFNPKEWEMAKQKLADPGARDTIVMMTPDQFHRMAHSRTPDEISSPGAAVRRGFIENALKTPKGLDDIPYLKGRIKDGVFDLTERGVGSHNGRHRMDKLKEMGLEMVPVRLKVVGDGEFKGWGSDQAPREIRGQEGALEALPENIHTKGNAAPEKLPELSLEPIRGPRSQRGAIDAKGIGEGVKKLVEKIAPKVEAPDVVKNVDKAVDKAELPLNDLPGNADILKDYIPKDPKASDVINAALQETDSTLTVGKNLQSGATLTAAKTGSSLIQGVGRLFQNAQKRAERDIRNKVYPVEHQIKDLDRKSVVELSAVMKKEMFDEVQFTPDDLVEAGFTKKEIDAYIAIRQMQKEALEKQNKALAELGQKPITEREAYLSSRWQGDWRTPVYDSKGKLVWYIAETSKRSANKALQYLKDNGVDIDPTKSKIEFTGGKGKRSGDLADAYQTMLKIIDPDDPRTQAIKSVYEEGMANDAFHSLGQDKHFKEKSNVRGFIGDRPWNDPKSEAFDLFKSQFNYTKNAHTWAEQTRATTAAKEILSNETLQEQQPNNLSYARDYVKNKLGYGENAAIASLESDFVKFLGSDRASFNQAIGSMKTFFILSKLGFSTPFMLANYVQPLMTAPMHSNLTSMGFKHNAFKTLVLGGMDGHGAYLRYNGQSKAPMSKLGEIALRYAEDNGIVNRNMFDETAGLGKHALAEGAENVAGAMMKGIEHISRLNAFMSFVHHLDQAKVFTDPRTLFQKAEELTNMSMVDYRPGERPMAFDKMGMVGNAMSALQTFKFNYYNQLSYFYKEAHEGRPRGLVTFLAMQGAMGGTLSMPFLQEIDDVWETVKSMLPDDLYVGVKDFGVKKWMIQNMPDWASFGGMSKLTGANMSSRFDSGNVADMSFDSLFPFISDLAKQGKAVAGAVANPNETTIATAAHTVAPPGPIQGMVETGMDAFKAGPTQDGKMMYKSPRKLDQQKADYARTPEQEMYKKFGFTELEESKYKEQRWRQGTIEREMTERQRKIVGTWYDAVVRGDKEDMKKYTNRYIAYDGDPDNLYKQLDRLAMEAKVPKEILDEARANTIAAIKRSQRMKELLNGYGK
jgi:hypothetical protein